VGARDELLHEEPVRGLEPTADVGRQGVPDGVGGVAQLFDGRQERPVPDS
jgi:hypothetical protein